MSALYGIWSSSNIDSKLILNKMSEKLKFRMNGKPEEFFKQDFMVGVEGNFPERNNYLFEDKNRNLIIACEGEIYNAKDIEKVLNLNERNKKSESGFHVVPYLIEKFGIDFPKYINGIFTFCVFNTQSKELWLARDHVGCHSLYYCAHSGTIVFASSILAVLATDVVKKELDIKAPARYFCAKALTPPHTMFENVYSLKPGNIIQIKDGCINEHDYWNLESIAVDYYTSESDFVEQLRELLIDSISIRSDYGGKYATIVSGGLDSGIVASVLSKKADYRGLAGFSIAFNEESFSDEPLQKMLINDLNINHNLVIVSPFDFEQLLKTSIQYLDAPVNDNAFVGMYKVFQSTKNSGYEVLFEGEGPDEIFPAGNTHGERSLLKFLMVPSWIRRMFLGNLFPSMPLGDSLINRISRLACRVGMEENERMLTWRTYFHNKLLKEVLNKEFWPNFDCYETSKSYLKKSNLDDHLNKYQYGLIKSFLPDDLLYKDERMASANGITNRASLVDFRLVELALKIPSKYQINDPTDTSDGIKMLYKKSLKGLIPDEVLYRKKTRGFSQPTPVWYRNELKDFVLDTCTGKKIVERGIVNNNYIKNLIDIHLSGKANLDYAISSILIFELWCNHMLDE